MLLIQYVLFWFAGHTYVGSVKIDMSHSFDVITSPLTLSMAGLDWDEITGGDRQIGRGKDQNPF